MIFRLKIKHDNLSKIKFSIFLNYNKTRSMLLSNESKFLIIRDCEYSSFPFLNSKYASIKNWMCASSLKFQINEIKVSTLRFLFSSIFRNKNTATLNLLTRTIHINLTENRFNDIINYWNKFEKIDAHISISKKNTELFEAIIENKSYDLSDSASTEAKLIPISTIKFNYY